jgi:tRNA-2-methylthio-N6-dimethylallyladenosine synthase/ribosomal protein S12 methylthiotransferase
VTYISGPGVKPGAMVRAEIVESRTYDLVALS